MSAAATAAGYLYASGRLRGREKREDAHPDKPQGERPRIERPRNHGEKEIRVAAIPPREEKPRRTPTVQYRTRRWRPSGDQ